MRSVLTLLSRSLREDARLMRPHLLRIFFIGIIVWWLITSERQSLAFGAPGLRFFGDMALMNFLFITLAAISFFATAITEEKEEQTLGLLKMAGISPVSLLLGKSTSRLIGGVLLLSVQFPFTLLAVTLGGITPHQVVATYCSLLVYLLFAANLALFSSVVCRYSRSASVLTLILLALFLGGPPMIAGIVNSWVANDVLDGKNPLVLRVLAASEQLQPVSIWNQLQEIKQTGFDRPIVDAFLVSNLSLGLVMFLLSWWAYGVFVREDQPEGAPRSFLLKRVKAQGRMGTGRVWANALMWKDFHFIGGGKLMLLIKIVLYGLLVPGLIFLVQSMSGRGSGLTFRRNDWAIWYWSSMLLALGVELAVIASRIFRDELRWNTWSTLMLLPKSTWQLAYAKLAGCLLGLAPALIWFSLGVYLDPREFFEGLGDMLEEPAGWWIASQVVLFLHLTVLLSLLIKWGALPVAFTIMWVVNAGCLMGTNGPNDAEAIFVILFLAATALSFVLQGIIGDRLRNAAAK